MGAFTLQLLIEDGTSIAGFPLKNPLGFNVNPHVSTGIIGLKWRYSQDYNINNNSKRLIKKKVILFYMLLFLLFILANLQIFHAYMVC